MGTSLLNTTPQNTYPSLLKFSDNLPLSSTLKALSDGAGNDTMLELSTTALQIGGSTGMYWNNTTKRLGIGTNTPSTSIHAAQAFGASSLSQLDRMGLFVGYTQATFGIAVGGSSTTGSGAVQGTNANGSLVGRLSLNPLGGNVSVGQVTSGGGSSMLEIKGSGSTSATTSLLVQNSAGTDLFKISDNANFTFSAGGTADFFGNLSLRGIVDSGNAANNLRFIVPGATKSVLINADYSNSNAPSAMLEVQSTTKGFLPPRMTTAQKNAIATPAAGLMVYDTTLNKLCVYTTAWETITSI